MLVINQSWLSYHNIVANIFLWLELFISLILNVKKIRWMKKERKKWCKVAFLTWIFLKLWCDTIMTSGHVTFWVWCYPTFADILRTLWQCFSRSLQRFLSFLAVLQHSWKISQMIHERSRRVRLRVTDFEKGILKDKIRQPVQ